MRKTATLILCCAVFLGVGWGNALSQPMPQEDHFKVYIVDPPQTRTGQIQLFDQFGGFTFDNFVLDKFATPVIKNNEEWYDWTRHQTWWRINEPTPVWKVGLENQFGPQTWYLQNASYLVLPALKNQPGQLPVANHYKCYEVLQAPSMDIPVTLADQFDTTDVIVREPVVFCNPAEKVDETGMVYPIEDFTAHLACYLIDPAMYDIPISAYDQFGDWQLRVVEQCWLCVPSLKHAAVPTRPDTWGGIKQRYED